MDERMATHMKQRFPHGAAMLVAQAVMADLEPSCERITIAGSIRRQRPDPADIELLCIPRYDNVRSLFGARPEKDLLAECIKDFIEKRVLDYRLNKIGLRIFGVKNKLLVHVASGIPLDVFSTDARNWGLSLLVRTGPREFNIRYMAQLKALGKAGHAYGGITLEDGTEIECPTEESAFQAARWEWIEPSKRK